MHIFYLSFLSLIEVNVYFFIDLFLSLIEVNVYFLFIINLVLILKKYTLTCINNKEIDKKYT